MSTIQVVENPRRKRRSRRLSAVQRRAGFGGKRSMTGKRRTKRRRNPSMASLGNPRRRRSRSRRPRYTVTGVSRPRRRNMSYGGPLGVDMSAALYIGLGMFGTELVPRLARKAWAGIPTVGVTGYLVKAASAVAVGFAVGKVTNKRNGQLAAAGGLALIGVDLFRQYVAPKIGLAGFGGALSFEDISDVAGYVPIDPSLNAYVHPTHVRGAY